MDDELDDIEALKKSRKGVNLTSEERRALHKEVQKIMDRREKEEKEKRRAEMEYLYGLGLHAQFR